MLIIILRSSILYILSIRDKIAPPLGGVGEVFNGLLYNGFCSMPSLLPTEVRRYLPPMLGIPFINMGGVSIVCQPLLGLLYHLKENRILCVRLQLAIRMPLLQPR